MKLTVQHLAPYLPYGLKMAHGTFVGTITAITPQNEEFRITCSNYLESISEGKYKPLLIPLSFLNKDIIHNGDEFTPIYRISAVYGELIDPDLDLEIDIEGLHTSIFINLMNGYKVLQSLFEWHFDVFGLINAGVAIDKTLTLTT